MLEEDSEVGWKCPPARARLKPNNLNGFAKIKICNPGF